MAFKTECSKRGTSKKFRTGTNSSKNENTKHEGKNTKNLSKKNKEIIKVYPGKAESSQLKKKKERTHTVSMGHYDGFITCCFM